MPRADVLSAPASPHFMAQRRILILEDEILLSTILTMDLKSMGCEVVGPFRYIEDALASTAQVEGAVLDLGLSDGAPYLLARQLRQQGVSLVFYSGSEPSLVPPDLQNVPFLFKPSATDTILSALFDG